MTAEVTAVTSRARNGSRKSATCWNCYETVSLIDAYGRCRDDDKTHGQCMAIIRNTLAHARTMIGQ